MVELAAEISFALDNFEQQTKRKQAEWALQEREEKFRFFIERAPAAIAMVDTDMRYLAVSQRWLTDYNLVEENIIGHCHYEVLPDLPEHWQQTYQQCLAGAIDKCDEAPYPRSDGRIDWLRWEIHPWRTSHGDIGGIIIFSEMITERKQLLKTIADNQKDFHLMAEAMPQIVWIRQSDGKNVFLNQQWIDYTGLSMEESYDHGWIIPLHPDDKQRAWDAWQNAVNNNSNYCLECRLRRVDGVYRWWLIRGVPALDKSGNIYKWFGTCTDIHDLKLTQEALQDSTMKLEGALESMSDAVFISDIKGNFIHFNNAFATFHKFSSKQECSETLDEYLKLLDVYLPNGESVPRDQWTLPRALRGEIGNNSEFTLHRKDSDEKWIGSYNYAPIKNSREQIIGAVVTARDITKQKQTELELRIAATVFDSHEGMIVTDSNANILKVNHAFTTITDYSLEEVIGKNPRILSSGIHDKAFYTAMWSHILAEGSWAGEVWNQRKNGDIYPEFLTITAVKNIAGEVSHYVATLSDISARKISEDKIRQLAYYDPLTNLPNRTLFNDRLKHALAASRRSRLHGALLFIDLDNFKMLNDTLGHEFGDLLLQQVGQRLLVCIREDDTVARLGGDEFVIILENLSSQESQAKAQSEAICEKILSSLRQPYTLDRHNYLGTPSIGFALFKNHQILADELLRQADIAMYQAKNAGRNTLRFFDQSMQEIISRRVRLESDLRIALQVDQFKLYYQPQVDQSGKILGAEALIRWHHPERGIVSPIEFIPLAEEIGLILPIGQWVLETACLQLANWAKFNKTKQLQLAVNVSLPQFQQFDFVKQVIDIIERIGCDPSRLKLELTESMLAVNIEDIISKQLPNLWSHSQYLRYRKMGNLQQYW